MTIVDITPDEIQSRRDAEVGREIAELDRLATAKGMEALELMIMAGEQLEKAMIGLGASNKEIGRSLTWAGWLAQYCPGMSEKRASNYRRLYRSQDQIREWSAGQIAAGENPSQRGAIAYLQAVQEAQEEKLPTREEIVAAWGQVGRVAYLQGRPYPYLVESDIPGFGSKAFKGLRQLWEHWEAKGGSYLARFADLQKQVVAPEAPVRAHGMPEVSATQLPSQCVPPSPRTQRGGAGSIVPHVSPDSPPLATRCERRFEGGDYVQGERLGAEGIVSGWICAIGTDSLVVVTQLEAYLQVKDWGGQCSSRQYGALPHERIRLSSAVCVDPLAVAPTDPQPEFRPLKSAAPVCGYVVSGAEGAIPRLFLASELEFSGDIDLGEEAIIQVAPWTGTPGEISYILDTSEAAIAAQGLRDLHLLGYKIPPAIQQLIEVAIARSFPPGSSVRCPDGRVRFVGQTIGPEVECWDSEGRTLFPGAGLNVSASPFVLEEELTLLLRRVCKAFGPGALARAAEGATSSKH